MAAPWNDDPVLHDVEHVTQLAGFSGTRVYLASRDGQHWFVRKAATDAVSGDRLRRQVAKQNHFMTRVRGVMVPRILDEGICDDRFYFDMEFVRGWDAATFLRSADYKSILQFASILADYVTIAAGSEPALPVDSDFFMSLYRKLAAVQRNTHGVSSEALSSLFLALDDLANLDLPPTLCHGDLTFDNLIVTPGTSGPVLWAVDLLDAPYEHYWHDLAKLHQDLAGGWYLRRQSPIAQCVTDCVSRRLLARAKELDPRYPRFHDALVGITFARILPYITSDLQRDFVCKRVEYFARRTRTNARRERS